MSEESSYHDSDGEYDDDDDAEEENSAARSEASFVEDDDDEDDDESADYKPKRPSGRSESNRGRNGPQKSSSGSAASSRAKKDADSFSEDSTSARKSKLPAKRKRVIEEDDSEDEPSSISNTRALDLGKSSTKPLNQIAPTSRGTEQIKQPLKVAPVARPPIMKRKMIIDDDEDDESGGGSAAVAKKPTAASVAQPKPNSPKTTGAPAPPKQPLKVVVAAPKKGPSVNPPLRVGGKLSRAILESDEDDGVEDDAPLPARAVPVRAPTQAPKRIEPTIKPMQRGVYDDDFVVDDDNEYDLEESDDDEEYERRRRRNAFVDDDADEDEEYEEDDDDEEEGNDDEDDDEQSGDSWGYSGDHFSGGRMTARQLAKEQGVSVEPLLSLPYAVSKKSQEREEQRKRRAAERASGVPVSSRDLPSRRTMKEVDAVISQLLRRDFATPVTPAEDAKEPQIVSSQPSSSNEPRASQPTISAGYNSKLESDYIRWTSTPKGNYVTFTSPNATADLMELWQPFGPSKQLSGHPID